MQLTGLFRMTVCRLEIAGQFPRRRRLSGNSVPWLDSEALDEGALIRLDEARFNATTRTPLGEGARRELQAVVEGTRFRIAQLEASRCRF